MPGAGLRFKCSFCAMLRHRREQEAPESNVMVSLLVFPVLRAILFSGCLITWWCCWWCRPCLWCPCGGWLSLCSGCAWVSAQCCTRSLAPMPACWRLGSLPVGEAAGDFFFLSPASFFLQACMLCEPVFWQKVQLRLALSTVQAFDLWAFAPHKKHLMKPSFFLVLSRFGRAPPVWFTCFLLSEVMTVSLCSRAARFSNSLNVGFVFVSPVGVFRHEFMAEDLMHAHVIELGWQALALHLDHVRVQWLVFSPSLIEELLSPDEQWQLDLKLGVQLVDHVDVGVLCFERITCLHPHIWINDDLEKMFLHTDVEVGVVGNLKPI